MIRRTLAVLVPIVLLVACSTPASSGEQSQGGGASLGESSPPAGSTAPGDSAAPSVGGGGGGGTASVDLTITGGDYAGHYQVDITSGGCSTGATGPGTFSVASVTVDPAEAFQGPQLTLYDADAASAAGGDDSQFSAAFPFNNYGYTVEVNPYLTASQGSNFGSGTATLDNRGTTATVTIEGTTSAGEQVQATIECHQVTNF